LLETKRKAYNNQMCRALLYLGEPVLLDDLLFQPDSSLVKQSYMPRMLQMLNLAGFGMMVWDDNSHDAELPFRYGSTTLPVFDRNLKNLAQKIRANCFLGHVRGVALHSEVSITDHNVHPFWYPGTKLVMAHNGDLYRFGDMRDELRQHIRPEIARHISGATDSEWVYALLLSQLDDPARFPTGDEVRRAVDQTISILGKTREICGISVASSVNLFITDGHQSFALRFCFDFGCYQTDDPSKLHEANLAYLSLWYTSGREYGFYDDEWKMIGGAGTADSVMVASEPLTTDITTWLEVPEFGLLHAERHDGRPVTRVHYINA
jgi:predicted glutamine amidotransferase